MQLNYSTISNRDEQFDHRFNSQRRHKIIVYLNQNYNLEEEFEEDTKNNSSEDDQSDEQFSPSGCRSLVANDDLAQEKLRFVGEQLVQFIRQDLGDYDQDNSKQPTCTPDIKMKTIWAIYSKVLKIEPINDQWNYKAQLEQPADNDILRSRQQVLNFIENLNGYCDSISSLRLILKSHIMFHVLEAYRDIVDNIEGYKRINCEHPTSQLTNSDAPIFEYSV